MRASASRSSYAALTITGVALTLAAVALLAGCGKTGQSPASGGPLRTLAPVSVEGAVTVSTRNTTRLGGADAVVDAAAVARAVYPGLTAATRPQTVVLVDKRNWLSALAVSSLAGAPVSAPILYSDGNSLPDITRQTLEAMHPLGASAFSGAQVIRVSNSAPVPKGYLTRSLPTAGAAGTAAAVERLLAAANAGAGLHRVIVVPMGATPALTMPAAGLAAESGAPILFLAGAHVPAATAAALTSLHRPSIYVVDPAQVSPIVMGELHRFGPVTPIVEGAPNEARNPIANAIAVARYTNGSFGWGVKDPGHGLVFANIARPFDAPAAALLSATAEYGPLLLFAHSTQIPPALSAYLGDIQPAYTSAPEFQPVRGVYNHGWLIGDEHAISAVIQAELDSLLEISPRREASEEAAPIPQVESPTSTQAPPPTTTQSTPTAPTPPAKTQSPSTPPAKTKPSSSTVPPAATKRPHSTHKPTSTQPSK